MGVGRSEAVVLVHTGDAAADDDADADDVEVVDREVGSSSSSDAIIFLMIRLLEDDVVVVVGWRDTCIYIYMVRRRRDSSDSFRGRIGRGAILRRRRKRSGVSDRSWGGCER